MLSLQEALLLPSILTNTDLPYLPLPNTVEVVFSDKLPPVELTKTAFVIPLLDNQDMMSTNNRRRGLEIPGGHIDPGETPEQAGVREVLEETGCRVEDVVVIGYLRMTTTGEKPEGYRYPFPVGFQVFYAGRVREIVPYEENDECLTPIRLSQEQIMDQTITKPNHRLFYQEACRVDLESQNKNSF